VTVRPIDSIRVGPRHRRDLGDVDGLAASIAEVGLLHPVVITSAGILIAGARRLAAAKRLGWTRVPIHVVDLDGIARGELHENAGRKDFLPSEIDAIRLTLEPIERAAAKQRMSEGGRGGEIPHPSKGRAADKVAAFAGRDRRTIDKIAAVMKAAEACPEKFGQLAEDMDQTGRVDGPHPCAPIATSSSSPAAAVSVPTMPIMKDTELRTAGGRTRHIGGSDTFSLSRRNNKRRYLK
jgi:ParB-like nuclease domain